MTDQKSAKEDSVQVIVEPGICGFPGSIRIFKADRYAVRVELKSGCEQIRKMAKLLEEMTMSELFLPASRNPVFRAAEKANLHASCVYPTAILKAVEVALEMALAQDASIRFRK